MGNSQGSALAYMDVNYPEDPILRAIIGDRGDEMNEGRMAIFNGMATHAGVSCGCHSNYVEECCILVGQIYGEMNPSLVADSAPQLTSCTPYSSVTSDTKTGSFTLSSIDAPATSTSSTTGSTSTTGIK